jgi:hypothetical protein
MPAQVDASIATQHGHDAPLRSMAWPARRLQQPPQPRTRARGAPQIRQGRERACVRKRARRGPVEDAGPSRYRASRKAVFFSADDRRESDRQCARWIQLSAVAERRSASQHSEKTNGGPDDPASSTGPDVGRDCEIARRISAVAVCCSDASRSR